MDSTADNTWWTPAAPSAVRGSQPSRPNGAGRWSLDLFAALAAGGAFLFIGGCRTDQAAQDHINQMRAEQIAIEDRYAALRNEYEKLRNRLAAQGDPEAKAPRHPSALPLNYPPGTAPLDDLSLEAAWGDFDSAWPPNPGNIPGTQPPIGSAVPDLRAPNSVLEPPLGGTRQKFEWAVPHRLILRNDSTNRDRSSAQALAVRLLVTPIGQDGRPARPDGTYTLRLSDPTQSGDPAEIGYWQFPAEAVRAHLQRVESPANFAGVPLEVSVAHLQRPPSQLLAELEFHSLTGQRLASREILRFPAPAAAPNGTAFRDWAATLPVPAGVQGLMTAGQSPSPTAGNWRPDR